MIINYNSLSRGRDAWLKNDVGEVVGNPPDCTTKSMRTSWLLSLLLLAVFMSVSVTNAQTGIANYAFSTTTGATYTPITGGTVHASGSYDQQISSAITMGGTFTFGGVPYTTCYISANGFITFGAAPTGTNYTPLSTLGTTAGAIAAFAQDGSGSTVSGASPEVRYENIGGEFVVQFKDHANYSNRSSERLNFQIRLNYATGAVNIIYGTNTNPGSTNAAAQVGLRGATTTYADNVNNLYIANVPTSNTCDWSNALTGYSNSSGMYFSSTNTNVKIPTGLTYTWTPAATAPVRTFAAVSGITAYGATISWTAPTGATSYNVQYRTIGTCAWTNWTGNPVTGTNVTLTGLTSVNTYQVRVQAINGSVTSIYSHIPNAAGTGDGNVTAGTFTTPVSCVAPTALTATATSPTSSNMSWTASTSAPANGYEWELRTSGAGGSGATGLATSGTTAAGVVSATATTLTPSTAYTLYVRAHCATSDFSAWSSATAFTTPATCVVPTALLATTTSPTSVNLSWTASVSAPANGYEWELRTSGAGGSGATGLATSGTTAAGVVTATATTLTGNTSYTLYVRAHCVGSDYSTWATRAAFTTPCAVTSIPVATQTFTTTSIPACWTASVITGTNAWIPSGSNDGVPSARTGSYFMNKTWTNSDAIVTSQAVDMTTAGANGARVSVWIYRNSVNAATDRLRFHVNTAANLTGATQILEVFAKTTVAPVVAANGWYNYTVNIPASFNTATSLYVIAQGTTSAGTSAYGIGFDDFTIEQIPSCTEPSVLTTTGVTSTGVNFSWTASSTAPANGYDWEVRTSGAVGSGATGLAASGTTTGTTASAAALTANTTYSIYVRSHCGSEYSPAISTTVYTGYCVANNTSTTYRLTNVTTTGGSTNISNATAGSTNGYADYSATQIVSQYAGASVNLSLAISTSTYYYYVWVDWNNDLDFNDAGETMVATTSYAGSYSGSLTVPAAQSIGSYRMRIAASFSGVLTPCGIFTGGGEFEDYTFTVTATPTCFPPTAVLASSTATTANLSWTAPTAAPATGYDWEIRTSGAAGSGATGLVDSGSSTGLTASSALLSQLTTYTAYVRSQCTGPEVSTWAASAAFTTPCNVSNVPYVQDFSTAVVPAMPGCTSIQTLGFAGGWTTEDEVYSGLFPASQGNYLVYYYDEDYTGNAWFYTNAINLTGGVEYAISYKYGNDNSPTYPEKMRVAYGTSAINTAMTNVLADYPNITTANNSAFILFTPATTGVYYFGFNAYSAPDMDLLQLDDIKIDLAPTCRVPTALNIVAGVSTASLTWTAPTTGASGYEWAVTTSDIPPTSGTVSAGTSASVGSLDADTFYYLHVRSTCSGSDKSDWVSKLFITGHCMSTSTIAQNGYISSFVTTGGSTNISNTSTYASRGYSNFANLVVTNHEAATTSFTLTPSNGSTYLYGAAIWVDWNNDLDFDDANERVYSAPTSTSTSPRTGSFSIPAGTAFGNYRMRVKIDHINYASVISACGNIQVGETEDYTFTVVPVPPAITSFTPAVGCSNDLATTVVSITGTNLTGVTEVKLNDVVTPHTVVSDTNITVTLNASSTAGFFNLYKSGDGSSTVSAAPFEITQSPEVAPITGPDSVCLPASNTITLASETLTGVWDSSNVDVATVSSGGVVTPVAAGTVNINYTVTDSGCSTVVTYVVTVNNPIEITASTATQTVVTGGNTTFSVTATGSGAPSESGLTYQWQSTVDGDTFVTLTDDAIYGGTNTSTLTLTSVPEELNYTLYNVIITGACTSVTSDLAVLFVGDTGIETQPDPVAICDGGTGTASFTVVASSDVTTYEWQEDQGGDNWQILTNTGIYSGTSTPTLTLTGVTSANTGWKYKVVVTGIGSAESNPVSLTVSQGAAVTSGPANQTVCYSGGTTNFTVAATNASSYQWQYSADGSVWDNVVNSTPAGATYSGTTSATLNVTTTSATPSTGMHLYRAVVNSAAPCAAVTTATAQLSVNMPTVTLQPSPVTINAGNTATFTVNATGMTTPTYQWQYATAVGGPYANVTNASPAGVTYTDGSTNALSVVIANTAVAGSAHYYKVIVTSGTGCTTESNPAQLTIRNYCTTTTPTNTTAYFTAFTTTGGVTNISNTSTYSAGGYGNFTNLSASQLQGQTVNFSTTTTGGTAGVAVWVDWNQNATFEPSERVFNTTGYTTSPTGSFAVPATALAGTTRMRILMDWNTANPTDPCVIATATPRGEVEDYNFTVMVPPPCVTPVAGTVAANTTVICGSGTATLSATGYTTGQTGLTFQWHNSAGPIASATGFTYTTPVLNAPESYFFRATCANGNVSANSNTVTVNVVNTAVVSTTPGSHCGPGTVTLGATGSPGSELVWYSAATAGNLLGSGTSFTTPTITANTNYYVAAGYLGAGSAAVGAGVLTSGVAPYSLTNGGYGGQKGQYLITAAELTAAGIKAGNITSMAFEVTSAGSALQGFTVQMGTTALTDFPTPISIVGGLSTVANSATLTPVVGVNKIVFNTPFNWNGTSNVIVSTSWSNNNASNTSTVIKYDGTTNFSSQSYRKDNETPANLLTFTGSTGAGTSTFDRSANKPRFIFEAANVISCISARTVVAATITPPPALTLSASTVSACAGSATSAVTLTTPASNFDTYVWSPTQGVSGTAETGFTFNPTASATYTLTATNAAGCINTATVAVTISAYPVVSVTPPTAICPGEIANLTATQTGTLASTYAFTGSAGTYAAITGTAVPGAIGDDTATGNLPIGFTFNYNGTPQTVFAVSSNGFIELGSTASYANNSAAGWLPSTNSLSGRANVIAPFWDDNNTTGGTVQYATTGTAGNRVLTVQWTNTHIGSTGSSTSPTFSMQVLLYEANGAVEFRYGAKSATFSTVSASIGFSSAAGSYLSLTPLAPANTSTISSTAENTTAAETNIPSGTTYKFTPSGAIWSPQTDLYLDAAATIPYAGTNAITVYSKATANRTYTASMTNSTNCTTSVNTSVTVKQLYDFYADGDGDNYGTGSPVQLCSTSASVAPTGYAVLNGDCNDTNAAVNPGVAEIFYNGIDDNCDGNIDEGRQITTAILANRCGTTLTKIYQSVNCEFRIAGVTGYRFKVTNQSNPADEQTIDRPNAYFSFNQLTNYHYATNYSIAVMVQRNNVWLNYYGPSCTVRTPDAPTLAVCGGTVAAKGTFIHSEVLLYATAYRFEVTNVATSQSIVIDNGHQYFTFNEVSGFTAGAQYSVKVAVKTTGDWSTYGNPCVITAPGGTGPEIPTDKIIDATSNVFKVAAYPSPFTESFRLDITTESTAEVSVKVYDMLGKLIEISNASVVDFKEQRIGERYSAGVYNIIVTQGENVKTLRVIKR